MASIGQGNLEFHKLFRVMQTVGEMMVDRKYQVAQDLIPATFDEFMTRYVTEVPIADAGGGSGSGARTKRVANRKDMAIPCERRIGEQVRHAIVFFVPPNGLTSESMKEYRRVAEDDNCDRLIFVTASKPNATVKKNVDINNRSDLALKIQVFEEDDLAVNITKHELVPKHVPLEEEEVKATLQAHALEQSMLPRLLTTDPVAAYYGLERGRVVRIERKSMSAGIYVTYRQVV